jgi:uncharacterized membrane protein
MRTILLQEDINIIESRLCEFEDKTGCELLLVVADSSDPYPGASLRFGIISGFILSFLFVLFFEFTHHTIYPLSFFVITILMTWLGQLPFFKRLALSEQEVNRESYEKAVESFFNLGSSKVSHKVTAMIMVSLLEHKIHVLVDEKLKTRISQDELDELVRLMSARFADGNTSLGFIHSIEKLEKKILTEFGGKVSEHHVSELANQVFFI